MAGQTHSIKRRSDLSACPDRSETLRGHLINVPATHKYATLPRSIVLRRMSWLPGFGPPELSQQALSGSSVVDEWYGYECEDPVDKASPLLLVHSVSIQVLYQDLT